MLFLKILLITLGTVFLLFGYSIYFNKKYNLINGFKGSYKQGAQDENYGKKVGLIELFLGILLIIIGILLSIF